jgi:glucoamylase
MPLAWAHAEYLKLHRSLRDGRIFETPSQTAQRYLVDGVVARHVIWRPDHRRRSLPTGKVLRVEVRQPAVIHWDADGGGTDGREIPTRDSGLGIHYADLPTEGLAPGHAIRFTITWIGSGGPGNGAILAVKPSVVTVEAEAVNPTGE